jgi:hypothetical protein
MIIWKSQYFVVSLYYNLKKINIMSTSLIIDNLIAALGGIIGFVVSFGIFYLIDPVSTKKAFSIFSRRK